MYTFESRVRYSEVDSEQRMTLQALLDQLQDCCTFQAEELGIGVEYLAKLHAAWVLSSWQIEILREPRFGETIRTSTWPYDFKGFYGFRNFRMTDAAGETIVRANSVWVFMDLEQMRPTRIDAHVAEVYKGDLAAELEGDWAARKISLPREEEIIRQWTADPVCVARYHIDSNHHMNNSKYVQVAEEYLPADARVGGIRVEYKKAAVLGDVLCPSIIETEGQSFVELKNEEGKSYATVQFRIETGS